jgi:hypothetical protein
MHAPTGTRSPKRILLEEIPFIGVAVRHMVCARLLEEINPMHRVQLVNVTLFSRQDGVVDLILIPLLVMGFSGVLRQLRQCRILLRPWK